MSLKNLSILRKILKKALYPASVLSGFVLFPTVVIMYRLLRVNGGDIGLSAATATVSACAFVFLLGWLSQDLEAKPKNVFAAFLFASLASFAAMTAILGIPSAHTFAACAGLYATVMLAAYATFATGEFLSKIIFNATARTVVVSSSAVISLYFMASATYLPVATFETVSWRIKLSETSRTLNDREVVPYWKTAKDDAENWFKFGNIAEMFPENSQCVFVNKDAKQTSLYVKNSDGWAANFTFFGEQSKPLISSARISFMRYFLNKDGARVRFSAFFHKTPSGPLVVGSITRYAKDGTETASEPLGKNEVADMLVNIPAAE